MADRVWDKILTLGKNRVLLTGKFFPAGSSAPTGVKGVGFTLQRSATATYQIKVADKYPDLLHSDQQLIEATPSNKQLKYLSWNAATRILTLAVWDPALNSGAGGVAAADLAANAGTFVTFQLTMLNSTSGA